MKNLIILVLVFHFIKKTEAIRPDDPKKCDIRCTNQEKECAENEKDCSFQNATEYYCTDTWECPTGYTCCTTIGTEVE